MAVDTRGRAYAEYNSANLLTAFNVEQSTLVLLRGAELAKADGDSVAARTLLDRFSGAWPDLGARPALAERVKRVQAGLVPPSPP